MPHVVLGRNLKLEDVFEELKPIFVKNEKGILKTANAYIDRDEKSILIELLAIEEAKRSSVSLHDQRAARWYCREDLCWL